MAPLIFFVGLIYVAWQTRNYYFWSLPTELKVRTPHWPSAAVIVPFRNEAHNLPVLLDTLLDQEYPGELEFIFVDDHSEDDWGPAIHPTPMARRAGRMSSESRKVRWLRMGEHPEHASTVAHKKAALSLGILRTEAEIIVTTDADCHWPAGQLQRTLAPFRGGADVVLGPVVIDPVSSKADAFQALDLLAFQFLTLATLNAGRPALANGAHFAFRRACFERVGGYAGVDHLPSGDDVLLLHKFTSAVPRPGFAYANGSTPVATRPVDGWRATWRQRLRWAGKAGNYNSTELSFGQGLTFALCLSILVGLLFGAWSYALGAWALKAIADYFLLRETCRRFGREELMRQYWWVQLLYPVYIVAIGTAALLGVKTRWKDRRS